MKKHKRKWIVFAAVLSICILIAGYFVGLEIKKSKYPKGFEEYVVKYAAEYEVPQELIYAVIFCESGFDANAESPAGAVGLMQIMPDTYDWLSRIIGENYAEGDIYRPENNIRYGVSYLSYLYGRFGNWDTALAGYNAGHGRAGEWLSDTRYSEDGITLKKIPYEETSNYVLKVNKVKKIYIGLYFDDTVSSGSE